MSRFKWRLSSFVNEWYIYDTHRKRTVGIIYDDGVTARLDLYDRAKLPLIVKFTYPKGTSLQDIKDDMAAVMKEEI